MSPSNLDLYLLYRGSPRSLRTVFDSLYGLIPERLLRSGHTWRMVEDLLTNERLAPEAMRDRQMALLQDLLVHAKQQVPWYRETFRALGFDPASVQSVADLSVLPILEKADVLHLGAQLVARGASAADTYLVPTSGSTGQYLECVRDKRFHDIEQAVTLRYFRWYGGRLHWRHAVFYRAVMRHPDAGDGAPMERFRNRMILSQFHTDDRSLEQYVAALADFRPDHITIFPTTLLVLTRFCKRTGRRFPSPRHFTVYSENLYPEHKKEIEEYWGCPARNRYGHGEGCVSAAECEAGVLHLSPEFGVVEFLRTDGSPADPGEQARIVATGLHTHAMPLIRYDTGDRGSYSLAPCVCGRTLPVLSSVDGRADDLIRGTDGREVAALRAIFTHTHGIRLAQIVQERVGEVIINLVPDVDFDASVTEVLASNLRDNVGEALAVQFRIVDDVERSPSGKIRLVLSKIARTE